MSAYTAYAMAECAHQNGRKAAFLASGIEAQLARPREAAPGQAEGRQLQLAPPPSLGSATPAGSAQSTAVAVVPRRALGRSRLRMAAQEGSVLAQRQRLAWARWLRLARARADRRSAGSAEATGRDLPLPKTDQPLVLLLAEGAAAVGRFLAGTPAVIGGMLGGVLSAARSLASALASPFASAGARADGHGVMQQIGEALRSLGSAVVSMPSRLESGWDSLVKLAASALPEQWRHAASGVVQRAGECLSSSKGHLLQLVLWKHARGGVRRATSSALH